MRISDWSSDVCSADLRGRERTVSHEDQPVGIDGQTQRPVETIRHQIPRLAAIENLGHVTGNVRHEHALTDEGDVVEALCQLREQRRSEEHTSELQVTNAHLVCRLLLEKKKIQRQSKTTTHITTQNY